MPALRIAFLSSLDPASRLSWSGTFFYMRKALQRHCGEVVPVGPLRSVLERAGGACNRVLRKLGAGPIAYQHARLVSFEYGLRFKARLEAARADVVFAPVASTEIARLRTLLPIVYASDATFALLADYYPYLSGLSPRALREGNDIEARAMSTAVAVVLSSQWARASARQHYAVPERKLHVLPYGANLDAVPAREELLAAKEAGAVRLAFIGVDWERKGGQVAYEATTALRRRGLAAELTVIGCEPPAACERRFVKVLPRLRKDRPEDQRTLSDILLRSHFLLLPTRSDCTPIVLCEASAHGTPALVTDTGGVSEIVRQGENGWLFKPGATGEAYAERAAALLGERAAYEALVLATRARYETTLNWDAWGRGMREVFVSMREERAR